MTPPRTLNGYPVIDQKQLDDETWIICVWRADHPVHRFVVAKWSIHSPYEWLWGSYYSNITQAGQNFESATKGF